MLFPLPHLPPMTAAVSYLTKIAIQPFKGRSLYFSLWPSSAAGSSARPWGCTTIDRGEDSPGDLVLGSLKSSTVGAASWNLLSCLLCYWTLEKTGHRICFLSGEGLQQPGKEGMTFSLKEMQFVERNREEKPRLHIFLRSSHAAVPHLTYKPL